MAEIKGFNPKENEQAKQLEKLKKAFANIAQQPDGRVVLKEIFRRSGYDKSSIYMGKGADDIAFDLTVFREARRAMWIELRQFIETKQLKEIEYQ